jgi:hypothetical protein
MGCFVGGYVAGGVVGIGEGMRSATSSKLRANSILNGINKHGGSIGNMLGVLGNQYLFQSLHSWVLMFLHSDVVAFAHTSFIWCADQVDLDDVTNTQYATPIVTGFATGAAYKCTSGVRGALLSGLIGVGVSCGVYLAEPFMYKLFSKIKAG